MVAFALVLQACAQPGIERGSLRSLAPAGDAFAMPPPGGPAIVGVSERSYANAIEQEIGLAVNSNAPGQNLLRVQIFGIMDDNATNRLPDLPISSGEISREMRRLFPGIRMQRSEIYTQNNYGPFGYAVGRHGAGDLCFYGWQRISQAGQGHPFADLGTIQVRLRLCQAGASEEALLAVMYNYTITAALDGGRWNPFGPAPAPDPRLGQIGQPIRPEGAFGTVNVLPPAPVAASTPRPARPAPQPRRIEEPARERPAVPAGAPIVPPPPGQSQQIIVPPPPSPGPAAEDDDR